MVELQNAYPPLNDIEAMICGRRIMCVRRTICGRGYSSCAGGAARTAGARLALAGGIALTGSDANVDVAGAHGGWRWCWCRRQPFADAGLLTQNLGSFQRSELADGGELYATAEDSS